MYQDYKERTKKIHTTVHLKILTFNITKLFLYRTTAINKKGLTFGLNVAGCQRMLTPNKLATS